MKITIGSDPHQEREANATYNKNRILAISVLSLLVIAAIVTSIKR